MRITPPCTVSPCPRLAAARGLSLIEVTCVLSILTTLLGFALPGLHGWRERQALQAVAAELETDIQLARSTAVATQRTIRLETQALGKGSCYLLHTGSKHACACAGQGEAVCTGDAKVLRLSEQPGSSGVRLSSTQVSIAFDPQRGTVSPTATLKVADGHGHAIHQIVNIMGRVRSCSPSGASKGLAAC